MGYPCVYFLLSLLWCAPRRSSRPRRSVGLTTGDKLETQGWKHTTCLVGVGWSPLGVGEPKGPRSRSLGSVVDFPTPFSGTRVLEFRPGPNSGDTDPLGLGSGVERSTRNQRRRTVLVHLSLGGKTREETDGRGRGVGRPSRRRPVSLPQRHREHSRRWVGITRSGK